MHYVYQIHAGGRRATYYQHPNMIDVVRKTLECARLQQKLLPTLKTSQITCMFMLEEGGSYHFSCSYRKDIVTQVEEIAQGRPGKLCTYWRTYTVYKDALWFDEKLSHDELLEYLIGLDSYIPFADGEC